MANIGKWNVPSAVVTLLSAEMNGLGNNTLTVASAAVLLNLDLYADIWLHLAALSPVAPSFGTLYILAALDGATYPPVSAALRNQPQQQLTPFQLDITAATAQDVIVRNVLLTPAVAFKVAYDNQAGVTLAGSGNFVKMITYNVNNNG